MSKVFDAIVVGGGPSGLLCAGQIGTFGRSVLLLEKNEKLGKKIYITGKGRCNFSNIATGQEFLQNVVHGQKFLIGAINRFSYQDIKQILEENGTPTVVERGGRAFPKSNHASDVTKALENFCTKGGVQISLNTQVLSIQKGGEDFCVKTNKGDFFAKNCVIATGGVSYPTTGSTGDGYKFAKSFGIEIEPLKPALLPIEVVEDVSILEGLSLKNVNLTLKNQGKAIKSFFGEALFTKNGLSGPIVLSLSSFANAYESKCLTLEFDLKPALSFDELDKRICEDFKKYNNKEFKNALFDLLPKRLVSFVVEHCKIDPNKKVNQITSEQRKNLTALLKCLPFKVKKLYDISSGVVTSGGVKLSQINPKTMEAKNFSGLFFVGEVLDCDALTGGFNMQIAFSTGYVAGSYIGGEK